MEVTRSALIYKQYKINVSRIGNCFSIEVYHVGESEPSDPTLGEWIIMVLDAWIKEYPGLEIVSHSTTNREMFRTTVTIISKPKPKYGGLVNG